MRRILLLVAGALALALAVPGIASAHRGHAARNHHHHRRHHHAVKAHHTSTPTAHADAGRVASFTGGVLTITLADGSAISGKVTDDTAVNCVPAVQAPDPTAATARDGASDDQGDDHHGDDHGGRCHGQAACTVADLVPGAVVHEALLRLGANGAEFKLVLLVKQPAA